MSERVFLYLGRLKLAVWRVRQGVALHEAVYIELRISTENLWISRSEFESLLLNAFLRSGRDSELLGLGHHVVLAPVWSNMSLPVGAGEEHVSGVSLLFLGLCWLHLVSFLRELVGGRWQGRALGLLLVLDLDWCIF